MDFIDGLPRNRSSYDGIWVNHVLEDLSRACILDFGGSWDDLLHLVETQWGIDENDCSREKEESTR